VYDMYTFARGDDPSNRPAPRPIHSDRNGREDRTDPHFSVALQFALDRRDNGGDAQGRPQ
jgi:hypothetical protein